MVRKIIIETLVARIIEVNENNETTNTEEWKMESLDIELNIEGRTDYMENVKENVVKHFKEVRKEWKEEETTGNEESNTGEIEQIKYSKGYEKLKEDLSRTELEGNLENESEEIMEIDSNMTIEEMYKEVTNNSKKRKREDVGEWYDVGKKFKRNVEEIIEDEGINEQKRQREESSQILGNEEIDRGLTLMGYNNEQINEELRSRYRRMIFSGVRQEEIGRIL